MKEYILDEFWYMLIQDFSTNSEIDVDLFFNKLLWFFNNRNNLIQFITFTNTNLLLKKDKYKREYNKMLRIGDYLYWEYC